MSFRVLCRNNAKIFWALIPFLAWVFALGCATAPKDFDPNVTGPQLIVDPGTIRLGVATLTKTPIVFKGKGFEPRDSVFVSLLGVKKQDATRDVPLAAGEVDENGMFTASVGTLEKVTELLNAEIGSNKELETVIIVKEPPIPEGVYQAKAVSMLSDRVASTELKVKGPTLMDRLKDWLGGLMGKIVKK